MSGLPRSPAIVSPAPAGVDPARRVLRSTASGSTLGVWWRLAFGDSLLPVAETSISTTHDQATWFRAYDLSVSRRQTLSFDWDSVSRYYSAMSTPVPAPTHPVTALRRLVGTFPSVLLGYSGGVDSAFLAVVLRQELGRERMMAAIGRSASYPLAQWQAARALALRFDIPLVQIETRELEDPNYVANPTNRCFYCKTELWGRLVPEARARGLAVVCDGTNADDLAGGEHRPGYAAGRSAGVRSPLAEVGMTKAQVREASRGLGLPTWDAPAAPCLSSRVVYGLTITPERLRQVEAAERYLRELGVTGDLRGRHHGGGGAGARGDAPWGPRVRRRLDHVDPPLPALRFRAGSGDPRGLSPGRPL